MTCKEAQEEELEVLRSIYYGDEHFKELSPTSFQYKVGDSDDSKSFLLEISWNEQYPETAPSMNLDAFYNKRIIPEVKTEIINKLLEQAENMVGTAMTYSLIEWARDNASTLTVAQPENTKPPEDSGSPTEEKELVLNGQVGQVVKAEKKPKLSKQQKRRLYEKLDSKGEHPRGWDWIDVVKHLSQTGGKASDSNT